MTQPTVVDTPSLLDKQPLAVSGAIAGAGGAILELAIAFGVELTGRQIGAIGATITALTFLGHVVWTHRNVTPTTQATSTTVVTTVVPPTS